MEDDMIVQLYWDRDETAVAESAKKYGAYCTSIARNILFSLPDAEECVNETWLRAWKSMPPHRPHILSTFLGKITRRISFDMYRRNRREKRGGGQIETALDELAECVSGTDDTERQWSENELKAEINRFLLSLPESRKSMFIMRYWYVDSVSDIAKRLGMSENSVSVALFRIRAELKKHLSERGFDI